jgi:hypothetical protein
MVVASGIYLITKPSTLNSAIEYHFQSLLS